MCGRTNSEPRSKVTCHGTPCIEKTWSMNSWASMGAVMVSTVGTNMDCLVSWSTITRMVLYPGRMWKWNSRGTLGLELLEQPIGPMSLWLWAHTSGARLDIRLDGVMGIWPDEFSSDEIQGTVLSECPEIRWSCLYCRTCSRSFLTSGM